MDDFDLRDLLAPPLRIRSDLPSDSLNHTMPHTKPHTAEPMVLAMGYVPVQQWQDLYEPEEALCRGTIFRQLDLPFEGGAHL